MGQGWFELAAWLWALAWACAAGDKGMVAGRGRGLAQTRDWASWRLRARAKTAADRYVLTQVRTHSANWARDGGSCKAVVWAWAWGGTMLTH